jgi:hypothetical protein
MHKLGPAARSTHDDVSSIDETKLTRRKTMLDILALWLLAKWIGNIVAEKGHKSGWYKVLTVVLWFGGEIVGAIFGTVLTGASESAQCDIYLFALAGAAAGAGIAYLVATNLSPASSVPPPIPPVPGQGS